MVNVRRIFALENRGLLLDLVVFITNLSLMIVLARLFANLVHGADTDVVARVSIILFCLGLAFLQPLGAVLKRRQAHQRVPDLDRPRPRFLFHPFFYFLSKLVFLIAASGLLVDLFFSARESSASADYFGLPPWLYLTLFLGIPALAIGNTAVVYFYFHDPTHPPLFKFLESAQAETLGDLLLFLNMIGYQVFWALLMTDLTKDYRSIVGRFFTFAFTALLIYFPPRLFYLAEDSHRVEAWLMMLLANLPVIVRIVFTKG